MDYYAHNNMIDDSHVRIWEDGSIEELDAYNFWIKRSEDPIKDEKSQKSWIDINDKVSDDLEKKGFGAKNVYSIIL